MSVSQRVFHFVQDAHEIENQHVYKVVLDPLHSWETVNWPWGLFYSPLFPCRCTLSSESVVKTARLTFALHLFAAHVGLLKGVASVGEVGHVPCQ